MPISEQGLAFVRLHEGLVTRAYRDSVGVWTIGEGFTDRSAIFEAYWLKTRGHRIQSGDTITKGECDILVGQLMAGEYAIDIDRKCKPTHQCEFDAAASISYNCGPGSLNDGWARLLAAGDVAGGAAAVRVYKLTGGILRGRRSDEARLMLAGDYGLIDMAVHGTGAAPSASISPDDIKAYQSQLAKLGFYRGAIDGAAGPASRAAVIAYQRSHPDLVADGIVGPATRASLARDVAATKVAPNTAVIAGGATVVTAVVAAASGSSNWHLWAIGIGLAVLLTVGAMLVTRYRHELSRTPVPVPARPAPPPAKPKV